MLIHTWRKLRLICAVCNLFLLKVKEVALHSLELKVCLRGLLQNNQNACFQLYCTPNPLQEKVLDSQQRLIRFQARFSGIIDISETFAELPLTLSVLKDPNGKHLEVFLLVPIADI